MKEWTASTPSPFKKIYPQSKYPKKEALGLPCNSRRDLLDRASFSKWYSDSTPQAKPRNMNIQLPLNVSLEDNNISRQYLQESLRTFHSKSKVWKVKLQSCSKHSKLVFIIYSSNSFQLNLLVNDVL